ncbi:hypothetical protein E2320_006035 [Naja naja]|nr:hypothetical protein E2320_006035 [Naja naja]
MISCAFLSMWLSNTSTAAMVMPIVEAVAQQIISAEAEVDAMDTTYANGATNPALELEENISECEAADWKSTKDEGYSNGTAQAVCDIENEKNSELSQSERQYRNKKDHMICKIMCLCVAYSSTIGGLTTITGTSTNLIFAEQFNTLKEMFQCGKAKSPREQASAQVIKEEYKKLGSISYPEVVTLVLFLLMALLWFTRDPGFIPGWSSLFPKYPGFATDSTVALLIGLLFFIIPAKRLSRTSNGENIVFDYSPLISWKEFQACMPWEIAILVGGGFALADGCEAEAIHVNPLYILIPTTLCTSFAFLLPVANPPNAIVFSYGHLKVIDMVKAGLGINIIGVAVVMLAIMTWAQPMFNLSTYPAWAPVASATNISVH